MGLTTTDIIREFNLEPLPGEGGYYRETYRSQSYFNDDCLPGEIQGRHAFSTCIYYLITPDSFSHLHRLPSDEIWHFYLGDPVEQLQLFLNGNGNLLTIGNDLGNGESPQVIVRELVWQGTKLKEGGQYALLGITMSPGFNFSDYEAGNVNQLINKYPGFKNEIIKLI